MRHIVGGYRCLDAMQDEIRGIRISRRSECRKFISAQPADDLSVAKHCPQ